MRDIEFHVPGIPAPQGSKRYLGPGRAVESSKRLPAWRADVRAAASWVMTEDHDEWWFEDGVAVELTFVLDRPKNHYRTGKNAALLRELAPPVPMGTPDVDKLARAVLDALTKIVYRDDAQVVELTARKVYTGLIPAGCLVSVRGWRP